MSVDGKDEWELGDHVLHRQSGDEYTIVKMVTTETLNSTKKHKVYTVAKDENAQGKVVSMDYNNAMMKNIFAVNKEYVEPVRMFPIIKVHDERYPNAIPWEWLDEDWAQHNHHQSLDKLASRGGLYPTELYWNLNKLSARDEANNIKEEDAILWLINRFKTTDSRLNSIDEE